MILYNFSGNLYFWALLALIQYSQAIKIDVAQYVCSLMVNGTKIMDPENACSIYYYDCIDGVAIANKCDSKEKFDKDRNDCYPSGEVSCQVYKACPKKETKAKLPGGSTTTFENDPYSCQGYYICPGDQKGECINDMTFHNGKCWPDTENVECDIDLCLIVPSYTYFGYGTDGNNCKKWQFCKGNDLTEGDCPGDTYFDRDDGACDYELSANCRPSAIHKEMKVGDYCNFEGFQIDPNSCTHYFQCEKNKVHKNACISGYYYTEDQTCTSRSKYSCKRGNNPCQGLSQTDHSHWQWVANPDNCNQYYACSNDSVNGDARYCPTAHPYFNEELQICQEDPSNACARDNSDNK